jgi:hypothetical protein
MLATKPSENHPEVWPAKPVKLLQAIKIFGRPYARSFEDRRLLVLASLQRKPEKLWALDERQLFETLHAALCFAALLGWVYVQSLAAALPRLSQAHLLTVTATGASGLLLQRP